MAASIPHFVHGQGGYNPLLARPIWPGHCDKATAGNAGKAGGSAESVPSGRGAFTRDLPIVEP